MSVLQIAHRAGNDLSLLGPALALGADLIEADVYLRRQRLEVRHGHSLGPVPWLWEPPALVRNLRLELSDLRAAVPDGATLMLDLKGRQRAFGELVRESMNGGAPYVVCSREWAVLDAFAGQPDVRIVHSAGTRRELRRLERYLVSHPTWGVSLHRDLLSFDVVAGLRARAEVVMTWPVDTAQAYDEVVDLGVNGVITNDLAVLAAR